MQGYKSSMRRSRWTSFSIFISFVCGMTFFALLQQTHIFWTGNNIQRNDERQLRGSSSSADFFLTSQVPAKEELGRAGWTILHRIAAKFSKEPEGVEKKNMKQFLTLFAKLYPCPDCAKHFQQYLRENPANINNNEGLVKWMCTAHNAVNERKGKKIFPCDMDHLITRWGACGCEESESKTIQRILDKRRQYKN